MKKLLLALPLFAGVSWAGTTYYIGAQTETAYTRLLEQLNSSDLFVVESKEYDAGFMNSTAVTEVRLKDDADKEVVFLLEHKINHSPVSMVPATARFGAANIITTLKLDDIDDEDVLNAMKSFDTGEPFIMTTDVAMDGATSSEIVFNAFDHTEDGTNVKTSSSVFNIETSSSGNISGNGLTKDININQPDKGSTGDLSNLSMTFNMSKLDDADASSKHYYDVEFDAKLEEAKIEASADPKDALHIKGVHYAYDQKLTDASPSIKFDMGIDSIEADGVPLKSGNLNASLTGFSSKEIIANTDFFAQLQNVDNPEELLFTGKGLDIIQATFQPDTKFNITTDADSSEGKVNADITLWFTGNGSADGYTGMVTVGDLAKSFAGSANIKAAKSIIMSTPLGQMLEEPMAQAYLTITDNDVTLDASLDKLVLKVNEQMIPLELMAGEMLDMPLEFLLQM